MNLDLNIKNYKIPDLERFFQLPLNYTPEQFKKSVNETYLKIKNSELDENTKEQVLQFIQEAKNSLKAQQPKVEKPPIQYTSSKVEEFVEGNLNPLEKRSTTKTICIDSIFRNNYFKTKSTDFLYVLPMDINKVVSMQMTSLEIPNIWNSFSSTNNTFQVDVYNVNTGTSIMDHSSCIITIPEGNYMSDIFQTTINNIFQSYPMPGLNFLKLLISVQTNTIIRTNVINDTIINSAGVTFTGDLPTSAPIPFDPSGSHYSPNFYFTITFPIKETAPTKETKDNLKNKMPNYKSAGWMMGFRESFYMVKNNSISYSDSITPITYHNYLKSESSYGSTIDNYIFLEVNDFHNNYPTDLIVSTNDKSYLGNNILARIVLLSGSNTIVWNNSGDLIFKKREYFGPTKIEKLQIRILNRFGEVIDLRGNDFSVVLELKQLY